LGSDSAAKPSTSSWTISSDIRVKENIINTDINESFNLIKKLPLKNFNYKKEYGVANPNERFVGFIAQDIEEILPQCVTTNKQTFANNETITDFKSLNVDQINKHLIGAVQEVMNRLEKLESENKLLRTIVENNRTT
jgi:hypothetical protein